MTDRSSQPDEGVPAVTQTDLNKDEADAGPCIGVTVRTCRRRRSGTRATTSAHKHRGAPLVDVISIATRFGVPERDGRCAGVGCTASMLAARSKARPVDLALESCRRPVHR